MGDSKATIIVRSYFGSSSAKPTLDTTRTAIQLAQSSLMLTLGRSPHPATCKLFADLLDDLTVPQLIMGYSRALDEARDWLTPAQLRVLCVGENEEADASAAWVWVLRYLRLHGPAGLAFWSGNTKTEAPELPERTARALASVGGNAHDALVLIKHSAEDELRFIRPKFVNAYKSSKG